MEVLFNKIRALIKKPNKTNPEVSDKSIYWQLDHSLRVIFGISKILVKSNPNDYSKKFNLAKIYVFASKSIPRGKAKAPKQVVSDDNIKSEQLIELLDKTQEAFNETSDINANSNFDHAVFGMLDLKKSIKFLHIHTEHHLKIVKDIINK